MSWSHVLCVQHVFDQWICTTTSIVVAAKIEICRSCCQQTLQTSHSFDPAARCYSSPLWLSPLVSAAPVLFASAPLASPDTRGGMSWMWNDWPRTQQLQWFLHCGESLLQCLGYCQYWLPTKKLLPVALLRQKCKDVNKMPKSGRKQKPWCLCLFLEFSELSRIAIAGHHPQSQYISTSLGLAHH